MYLLFNKQTHVGIFLFGFSEQALDHLRSKPDKKAWIGLACGCLSITIIGIIIVVKVMQSQKESARAKLYEQILNGEVIVIF